MRALFVFGFIGLYIACAFVQPSEANLRAIAARAQQLDALDAAALINTVNNDEHVSVLVDTATNALTGLIPDPESVLTAVTDTMTDGETYTSSLPDLVERTENSSLRLQFERIQWAAQKNDPRLCKVLAESNMDAVDSGSPTFGDLLAFCLAATTLESSRCNQIDPTSPLYDACLKELDRQT